MNAAQQLRKHGRISGGAVDGTPVCPTCHYLLPDKNYPGWGWCGNAQNRVFVIDWPNGFTPSQSPDGSCELHPARVALKQKVQS